MIKEVSINGVDIPNVTEVDVQLITPGDERGIYREETYAAIIKIERDSSEIGMTELFNMTTNDDGRKVILKEGKIICQTEDMEHDFQFELKKFIISKWGLKHPEESDHGLVEYVELRVGEIGFNADGSQANFELESFK